ncbi:fungal-specific transcription factor [Podospora didyma]|uniref:Fungal-specific transcription factor n=1 Tax=Podospora didyma TaxID=330526 RepID=A0AAE0NSA0_9PEZI|nr:fungal-specific transcription factor [Podospora didyma]
MAAASPPSSPETAAVRPVACLRCRNRRSFCSKEKPKCNRCREGGHACIYEEARKVAINESYLRALEAKVKAYEGLSRPQNRDNLRSRIEDDNEFEDEEDEHTLLAPFTQLAIDRPSTSFKGPGSSDYFLRNVRELSGIPGDDSSLDLNPNFYDPGAIPSRRLSLRTHVRLPPFDFARRLFAAHYTYIGTIFAFTHPETFDIELLSAYRGQPDLADKDACLAYAKVLVTLAFGQLYSVNQWIDFKGPPGFEYFSHALQLLPDSHEEGSILCVETLALVGYFMQNMNRRDSAFLYIGLALRMAISLGLHQEVSWSHDSEMPTLDEAAREHRRRVWWSIYSLDRILSVKSGNPTTIQDDDIGVKLPSKLPTEPDYCPAVVLRHYTELSRILGEITKAIYRKATMPKSGRRLMASVQSIILALSKWNRDLPDELRFDPAKLSISRESVSTFSHYYQCINMTARPLLFHVVQRRLKEIRVNADAKETDWKGGLSQTTIRVIEMCVSAAQDTVNMMMIAAQRDLVATYGYMDGEHIFSGMYEVAHSSVILIIVRLIDCLAATIVLVMACVAFPTNAANAVAMNAGLGLLRGMAERGNSHIGARYELLAHLRSVFLPGEATQEQPSPFPNPSAFPCNSNQWSSIQSPMTASLVAAQAAISIPEFVSPPPMSATSHRRNLSTDLSSSAPANTGGLVGGMEYADDIPMFTISFDDIGTGTDFMLWEEGFANPALDAGYDLSQWTQGA